MSAARPARGAENARASRGASPRGSGRGSSCVVRRAGPVLAGGGLRPVAVLLRPVRQLAHAHERTPSFAPAS